MEIFLLHTEMTEIETPSFTLSQISQQPWHIFSGSTFKGHNMSIMLCFTIARIVVQSEQVVRKYELGRVKIGHKTLGVRHSLLMQFKHIRAS